MAKNPYKGLRQRALSVTAADVELSPSAGRPDVFGVVVDLGMSGGTATLVAFSDGSTSMYYSTGGGVIGAGAHKTVAAASLQLLDVAQANLALLTARPQKKLPKTGVATFAVRTYTGTRWLTAPINDLLSGAVVGGALFSAANDVLTQLRLADEQPQPG